MATIAQRHETAHARPVTPGGGHELLRLGEQHRPVTQRAKRAYRNQLKQLQTADSVLSINGGVLRPSGPRTALFWAGYFAPCRRIGLARVLN